MTKLRVVEASKTPKKKPKKKAKPIKRKPSLRSVTLEVLQKSREYDSDFALKLVEHMRKGFSFDSFGAAIGVPISKLKEWKLLHDDFQAAAEIGEAKSIEYWEKLLIDMALGRARGNGKLVELVMKCRFLWTDKRVVQHTGAIERLLSTASPEEIKAELRQHRKRAEQAELSVDGLTTDGEIDEAFDRLRPE